MKNLCAKFSTHSMNLKSEANLLNIFKHISILLLLSVESEWGNCLVVKTIIVDILKKRVLGTPVVGTEMTTESFIIVCRVEAEGKAVAQ